MCCYFFLYYFLCCKCCPPHIEDRVLGEGGFGSHPPLLISLILIYLDSDQILSALFHCFSFSSLHCMLAVTALVLSFSPYWKTGIESEQVSLPPSSRFLQFILFLKFFLKFVFYFWDRERQSMNGGGAERDGDTESEAGSRLWAISKEPDAGLKLTDREIVTWAEVGRLTDWATQAPPKLPIFKVYNMMYLYVVKWLSHPR